MLKWVVVAVCCCCRCASAAAAATLLLIAAVATALLMLRHCCCYDTAAAVAAAAAVVVARAATGLLVELANRLWAAVCMRTVLTPPCSQLYASSFRGSQPIWDGAKARKRRAADTLSSLWFIPV